MDKITLEQLVAIAAEVEQGDPFDWNKLKVGKAEAFKMIGTTVLDMFDKSEYTTEDKLILLATVTKLTVENMILHMKLLSGEHNEMRAG